MKRSNEKVLYEFQQVGVQAILSGFNTKVYKTNDKYFTRANSFLLCDEMGLGKTIQSIEAVYQNPNKGDLPILIVCPASVVNVWVNESYLKYRFPNVVVFVRQSCVSCHHSFVLFHPVRQ